MAGRITELDEIVLPASNDWFEIVDQSATPLIDARNKRLTHEKIFNGVKVQNWLGAKAWERGLTNIPGSITSKEFGAENLTLPIIKFPESHQSEVFLAIVLPANWDVSTIKFKPYWTNDAGLTTEVVSWKLSAFAYADSDALGAALSETEIEVTDTWLAQDDIHIAAQSAAVTVAGTPVTGELVVLKFQRDTDDASDTLTGDAIFIGGVLEYTINKTTSVG